jgi:two-component system, OmpR family, phosphate regulon sensor histidine kinase PhoR
MSKRKLIGSMLLEKNLVTEDQIKEAVDLQKTSGKPLGNVLVELGYVTSNLITEVLNAAQNREEQLAKLLNVSSDMIKQMELTSLLKYTMDEAARIIYADRCTLYLIDENTNELRSFIAQRAEVQEIRMPLGEGIAGFVAKTGELVNLEDAYKSPIFDPRTDKETGYRTRSVLCIPLKDRNNNKIIGVLQALNKKGDTAFTFNDEWLFKSFGSCATHAISAVLSKKEIDSVSKAKQNMERLSLTVENIHDGVIMINKEEDSVVVNPAARWILGLEINKALNKKDTIERLEEIGLVGVQKWLEGNIEDLPSQEITIREPEARVVKVDFADIEGHSRKNRKGFVAVLKDITKEREIERIKSEFITIASHEFISPITSIKNAISLLIQETMGPNTEPQQKFLKMIKDSTEYLTYLTTTLFDLSLIESNKMYLKLEKVDIGQIVRSVVDNTQYLANEKEISLIVKDDNPPPALADQYRTRQAMLALLDNAYKFTPNGGEIVVNIKLREKKEVEFSVKDNGPGISLNEQEKIFERFYQIGNFITRQNGGMGLGLSICKDIVTAQGGRLWVESKKEEGSKFVFTLPLFK